MNEQEKIRNILRSYEQKQEEERKKERKKKEAIRGTKEYKLNIQKEKKHSKHEAIKIGIEKALENISLISEKLEKAETPFFRSTFYYKGFSPRTAYSAYKKTLEKRGLKLLADYTDFMEHDHYRNLDTDRDGRRELKWWAVKNENQTVSLTKDTVLRM